MRCLAGSLLWQEFFLGQFFFAQKNIGVTTRRRMAREGRGAGSSVVSNETLFTRQYIKDML